MQYRRFGSCDFDVSTLGFGLMRLPLEGEDSADIDEAESTRMVHRAIEGGVNYLDTAYAYHGGNSERFAARALAGGLRERIVLATKMPTWLIEAEDDFDRYLDEQLEKLGTDYLDVYLLHALHAERWKQVSELGVTAFLDRALEDGRVRHVGFSFHDDLEVFREIVDSYDWDMCLIQLNFMDRDYQAGVAGMRYAAEQGMAVAVMEPLRGGKLAGRVPDDVRELWAGAKVQRTPAEWALRWVCNHPEVSVVLSGMSSMEQLEENMETVSDARPNSLTDDELALIDEVRDIYLSRMKVNCTECGYCVPCPSEVAIPRVFGLYNDASMYESVEGASRSYSSMLESGKGAPSCVECGQCEEACPQNIPIIETLKRAHEYLTG
jgi:uncharacterized protein